VLKLIKDGEDMFYCVIRLLKFNEYVFKHGDVIASDCFKNKGRVYDTQEV